MRGGKRKSSLGSEPCVGVCKFIASDARGWVPTLLSQRGARWTFPSDGPVVHARHRQSALGAGPAEGIHIQLEFPSLDRS